MKAFRTSFVRVMYCASIVDSERMKFGASAKRASVLQRARVMSEYRCPGQGTCDQFIRSDLSSTQKDHIALLQSA